MSWVHGLIAGSPLGDSKACLSCHKMADTAFNPHGASGEVLFKSTKRVTKVAATLPEPFSARAQSAVFPTHEIAIHPLYCATCHQEHQGASFKLGKISNEQCRSCHVAKFDSFDGNHPQFESYPFKRRTRLIYDHAAHFDKHFHEVAKKDPAKRIPASCSTCHDSREDKRIMAVAPFEQTCSGCHLDQITGKERASGPKGVAFLTLPGLDLETLKKRNAAIGEWPEASEATLTPFMKIMISRSKEGRALIKAVDGLNLQDLAQADDEEIKSVTGLAWEIKRLFYALITGKASDVLGDLNLGEGAKLSPSLVADLTANIPRDVVIGAQQEWLPNLQREITGGPIASNEEKSPSSAETSRPVPAEVENKETSEPETDKADDGDGKDEAESKTANAVKRDPPQNACLVRVLGQCLVPGSSQKAEPNDDTPKPDNAKSSFAPAMQAGLRDVGPLAQLDASKSPAPDVPSKGGAKGQADELLSPTEEELREIRTRSKGAASGGPSAPSAASASESGGSPRPSGGALISIRSDVDPETWADYGGWYRQDYAIYYRPTGHKDKFVYSWLFLTGPQAPRGDKSPAAGIFDALANKDAQGSCTKCHSVDDIGSRGRVVNFSPLSVANKEGRFTNFIHEPHFGVVGDKGCLTCHSLAKDQPYLKSFEQGNPLQFTSNFGAVKKDLCQSCHSANLVRQDCLTCHKYHINGVITPIINTRLPLQ